MIFSHGNAEDIYLVESWLQSTFLKYVNVNAVVYEYTGYGENNGRIPTDNSLYDDIETVFLYLTEHIGLDPTKILLFGRSIGSGPTCFLAENYQVGGVIIHSGIASALRVVLDLRWTLPFDKFPNIDRVSRIDAPVFIIHGRRDEIVPFRNAEALYERSRVRFPPYYVDGAGHNNVERYAYDYPQKIKEFIKYVDKYWAERNGEM